MKPRPARFVFDPMKVPLTPQEAWQVLPASEWNADAARHLLRRTGWTARPDEVERALHDGLTATLDRLFPAEPLLPPKPLLVARLEENAPALAQKVQQMAAGDEKQRGQRELQERSRIAVQDLSLKWLQHASRPESAAFAKWVLFLSDVYVVSAEKVRNPGLIHRHVEILARHGLGPAPALTKAVSRSPAMVIYLDLNQNQRRAPNENFARELFELFVLGEGNYSERDIKEAARAFTGYRAEQYRGEFTFRPAQHDPGPKTVFGQTRNFTGDEVIDLAYAQPAASAFLPHELVKFYLLSDGNLPPEHLAALGETWRASGFDLRLLAQRFFGSRIFFAPEFRGNFIKSPLQFYLGLVQDLQLDVAPLPRFTLNRLREMGQLVFYPPNVRGWVGGRSWINSATLGSRRQLVETLFRPIDEAALNADELLELIAARSNGAANFTVTDESLAPLAPLDPAAAAEKLIATYLPVRPSSDTAEELRQFLSTGGNDRSARLRRLRRAAVTLLQSPEYHLC
jgi:uncharacterized protein (DUF1800 family)